LKALRLLFRDSIYGNRIESSYDIAILEALISKFLSVEALKAFTIASDGKNKVTLPDGTAPFNIAFRSFCSWFSR